MALKPRKPMPADVAKARLEELCVRGERCRNELAGKLYKWLVPQAEAARILDDLADRRFFDDARFAAAYARDKALFGHWGRRKIAMGLRMKRIDAAVVREAIDSIDEDEYRSRMLDTLAAKARSLKEGNSFEGRTKLYRFGVTHGYEPALVAAAIKSGVLFGERE